MRQSGAHRGPEKGKTDMQNKKKKNTTEIEGAISTAEASAALKARENEKPGKYSSPYADEIDSLLGSLSSREPFKYEASGDALFREYSDRYARDAKRAMKDTVGRVSSLTGGYGSSYAATAGSQAYGEKMSELGDIIPQLYKLAYTRYRDEGDDMRSLFSEYRDTDDEYYGRYRDGVSDWQTDLKRLAAAYESARDYEYDAARDTVKDEQWQREFDESVRQYEASLAEKQRQYDAGLAERQRQYDASLAQRRSSSSGSSGSGSGSTGYSPSDQKTIVSALEQYKKDYDKASSDGERSQVLSRARAFLSGLKYPEKAESMFELVFGFSLDSTSSSPSASEKGGLSTWLI